MKKYVLFLLTIFTLSALADGVAVSPVPSALPSVIASSVPAIVSSASLIDKVIAVIHWATANLDVVITAVAAVLIALSTLISALIALFTVIPGAQPEAFLHSIGDRIKALADWVAQFSKKPPSA